MTISNLISEQPAFVRNEKFRRSKKEARRDKRLFDCCFSISNLLLIIGSVFAFINSVKFLYDEPLYDHGDHLLSIAFYRQMTYIIAILPLILLIPTFNAADAIFLTSFSTSEVGLALLVIKIGYQVLMSILAFVGLVFVAPSIKSSSVASQLEFELRTHMKRRYSDEISYNLIDAIQLEYKCCDELWYKANYFDKLPLSCYINASYSDLIHTSTCADVLGGLVSTRCAIIALSLIAILISLVVLIGSDIMTLMQKQTGQSYELNATPELRTDTSGWQRVRTSDTENEVPDNNDWTSPEFESSLLDRLREHDLREDGSRPKNRASSMSHLSEMGDHSDEAKTKRPANNTRNNELYLPPTVSSSSYNDASILARANYAITQDSRPQSPLIVTNDDQHPPASSTKKGADSVDSDSKPVRGVLKKVSSYQRMDAESLEAGYHLRGDELTEQGTATQSRSPSITSTRRSLLNVRFADE